MSNLLDIQAQIQKLQKQADEIRSKEFDATVREILDKMQAFGISLKDLQNAASIPRGKGQARRKTVANKAPAKPAAKAKKAATKSVAPKFRGPNGEVWSGRGLTPRWMAALLSEGRSREEFAV